MGWDSLQQEHDVPQFSAYHLYGDWTTCPQSVTQSDMTVEPRLYPAQSLSFSFLKAASPSDLFTRHPSLGFDKLSAIFKSLAVDKFTKPSVEILSPSGLVSRPVAAAHLRPLL